MLVMALVFGMTVVGCGDVSGGGGGGSSGNGTGDSIGSNFQGVYTVYGYFNNFSNQLLPWDSLIDPPGYTGPSYADLTANRPTKVVVTSNSLIITGGEYDKQTLSARTNGNTLYVDGLEGEMGTFTSSGDFKMTSGLSFASEGAYILYEGGKTIYFHNIPPEIWSKATSVKAGVFHVGTNPQQAAAAMTNPQQGNIVAGVELNVNDLDFTITNDSHVRSMLVPLYVPDAFEHRWKGSGTYYVYLAWFLNDDTVRNDLGRNVNFPSGIGIIDRGGMDEGVSPDSVGNIPPEWRVTYTGSGNSIRIDANSLNFENGWNGTTLFGTGSFTGIYLEGGGMITRGAGGPVGGTYVYLMHNAQRYGLLLHIYDMGRHLSIGQNEANSVIGQVQTEGGVFYPQVTTSGMLTTSAWGGGTW
jgi:hypothetical protein